MNYQYSSHPQGAVGEKPEEEERPKEDIQPRNSGGLFEVQLGPCHSASTLPCQCIFLFRGLPHLAPDNPQSLRQG